MDILDIQKSGKAIVFTKDLRFFHPLQFPQLPRMIDVHLPQGKGGKIPLKEMSFFGSAQKSGDGTPFLRP